MKLYHKTPRQITERQYEDLARWMEELGDVSGLTHNVPTDELICGNQRSRVIDVNNCEIKIVEKMDKPDSQGTVALGYVIWKKHKYNYRAVVWDDKQCEMANIIANKAGGAWDMDILANEFDVDDLLDYGFSEIDLGIVGYEEPDSLEDLEDEYGEFDEEDIYFTIRIRVGEDTKKMWFETIKNLGEDEDAVLNQILTGYNYGFSLGKE